MTHSFPVSPWAPLRQSGISLADQLSEHFSQRIRNHGLRAGMRLPSVRAMAKEAGLSRFTVVQAYDRLVAQGLVQSRRGAGFYVCPPSSVAALPAVTSTLAPGAAFDTTFLLRSMLRRTCRAARACCRPRGWMKKWFRRPCVRSAAASVAAC